MAIPWPEAALPSAREAEKIRVMTDAVASHYERKGLVDELLQLLGPSASSTLHPDALAALDEFHLGGRSATEALAQSLELSPGDQVLDVGCGVGGPARFFARTLNVHVTGVDRTSAFVEVARVLSERTGLADRTRFQLGEGARLTFEDGAFDAVTLIHVGMNVEDKSALFRELRRVTRAGGRVLVYDVMRTEVSDQSSLVLEGRARRPPLSPPLHLGHLMGERWPQMFSHLEAALDAGTVGPVQIVAER